MSVVIVVESCFGNTRAVADAVAEGVGGVAGGREVSVVPVPQAPEEIDPQVDLLLVGAPTQDFSLPKPQTRRQAEAKGAEAVGDAGVREWIQRVALRSGLRVVTFDTSLEMRFSLGSAAKAAFKALKKRGFAHAERGESFRVAAQKGPLASGEEKRAREWGAQLAAAMSE